MKVILCTGELAGTSSRYFTPSGATNFSKVEVSYQCLFLVTLLSLSGIEWSQSASLSKDGQKLRMDSQLKFSTEVCQVHLHSLVFGQVSKNGSKSN